jgi:hypothetical protein
MGLLVLLLVATPVALAQDGTTTETTNLIDQLTGFWQIIFFGQAAIIVILLLVIIRMNGNNTKLASELRDLVPTRAIGDIAKEWDKRAKATEKNPFDDWGGKLVFSLIEKALGLEPGELIRQENDLTMQKAAEALYRPVPEGEKVPIFEADKSQPPPGEAEKT